MLERLRTNNMTHKELYPVAAQLAAAIIDKKGGIPNSSEAVEVFYTCLEALQQREDERGRVGAEAE